MSDYVDSHQTITYNQTDPYATNFALLRMDSSKLLEDFELFLRGTKKTISEDGESFKMVSVGAPLCNDEGVRHIMTHIQALVSPGSISGNFTTEKRYDDFVADEDEEFSILLIVNAYRWGITKEDKLNKTKKVNVGIIESIHSCYMKILITYMSRLIDNEERKSHGRVNESSTISRPSPKRSFFRRSEVYE